MLRAAPIPPRLALGLLLVLTLLLPPALVPADVSSPGAFEPLDFDRGANGLGLALRRVGTTARVLYVTAHPGRRAQRDPGAARARARRAHRAPHRDARGRRAERDRAGAVRRARRAAHGRAHGAPPLRRRRAVLRARLRVRLLLQRRGDLREVGPRRDGGRHRPRDPGLSARRDPGAAARGRGRWPAPPGGRPARAGGLPRRGRPGAVPRAGPFRVAGAQALRGRHRWLRRAEGHRGARVDERLRPAAGHELAAAGDARARDAPLPGREPGCGRSRADRGAVPPGRRRAARRGSRSRLPGRRRRDARRLCGASPRRTQPSRRSSRRSSRCSAPPAPPSTRARPRPRRPRSRPRSQGSARCAARCRASSTTRAHGPRSTAGSRTRSRTSRRRSSSPTAWCWRRAWTTGS